MGGGFQYPPMAYQLYNDGLRSNIVKIQQLRLNVLSYDFFKKKFRKKLNSQHYQPGTLTGEQYNGVKVRQLQIIISGGSIYYEIGNISKITSKIY